MEASCFGFEEDDPKASNNNENARSARVVKPTTFRFVCNSRPVREMAENVRSSEESRLMEQTLSPMPEKPVSITQIQELLLQDLNPSQFETLNSTMTNDTSFYEDENTQEQISPIKLPKATKKRKRGPLKKKKNKANEDTVQDENAPENESNMVLPKTPVRVFARPVRNIKPLEEIQNLDDDSNATLPAVKLQKNPVKKRGKGKNTEGENQEQLNRRTEEINSKFKQVEEFQLLVE